MTKPTVHDIAKEAGVSLATVDRVLNARPGVRQKTVAKVQDAVTRLGYVRDVYAANLARRRDYRFMFVLPDGPNQFASAIRAEIDGFISAQRAERTRISITNVPISDPNAIVLSLKNALNQQVDGIAMMLPESPQVRDAVSRLKTAGITVLALGSDLPNSPRDHFVGINSYRAGRTAGVLMGRFTGSRAGQILVVTNSLAARDSLERRLGFDEAISEQFGHLDIRPTIVSYDDAERMERLTQETLTANPAIVGLYSMGSGNAPMLRGLAASTRHGEITTICHELTQTTREALESNVIQAVITQNVGHLVRSAFRVMRAKADDMPIIQGQEQIRTDIVIRENLP